MIRYRHPLQNKIHVLKPYAEIKNGKNESSMKKIRTLMILAVTLILAFSVSGLAGSSLAEAPKPAKIVVKGSHEVAKGCSVSLEASVRPAEASQKVKWESSDKTIAKVSKSGKVTGLKAGNVTITVTSAENPAVRKKWDICIRSKPVRKLKLSASTDTLYLDIRKTAQIIVTKSPVSASDTLVWKSSNKKIATVSASGLVKAKKAGTVTITASTVDGSGKEASITFTVKKKAPVFPDPDPDKPINYYALIIGNSDYTEITKLPSVKRDVRAIKGALSSMSQHWKVTVKQNLTSGQIASAISSAFKGATDNDICLFIYSGHGMEDMDFEPGALMGITYSGDSQETDLLSARRLRSLLDKACPGKVIVMLEACGSGAVIYDGQELLLGAEFGQTLYERGCQCLPGRCAAQHKRASQP